MRKVFLITGIFLISLGFAKFILFNPLWGNKPWFGEFNFWYGKLIILATIAFITPFIITLIQFLMQKKNVDQTNNKDV